MVQNDIDAIFLDFRDRLSIVDLVEIIGCFAAISKQFPVLFKSTLNSADTWITTYNNVFDKYKKLLETKRIEYIPKRPDIELLDEYGFKRVIKLVDYQSDKQHLAEALFQQIKNDRQFGSSYVSNQTLEYIYKALLGDCSNKTLYDGACGFALVPTRLGAKSLFLEEYNAKAANISFFLATLRGLKFSLRCCDSLMESESSNNYSFDVAILEPPQKMLLGINECNKLKNKDYIFIKPDNDKKLPSHASDSLWLQLLLSKLKVKSGVGIILVKNSMLSRSGYVAKVRKYLIDKGLIEAIISLPKNILEKDQELPVMLLLRNDQKQRQNITYIDASEILENSNETIDLIRKKSQKIANLAYGKLRDSELSAVIPYEEIIEKKYDLSISRYMQSRPQNDDIDLQSQKKELGVLYEEFIVNQNEIQRLIKLYS